MDDVTILGKLEKGERLTEKKMSEFMQKIYEMKPSTNSKDLMFYGTDGEFRNFKKLLSLLAQPKNKND